MAFVKVASLWKSDPDRGGKAVLRGNSERAPITLPANAKLQVFPNDKQGNPKRPDYRLVMITPDNNDAPPRDGGSEVFSGGSPSDFGVPDSDDIF